MNIFSKMGSLLKSGKRSSRPYPGQAPANAAMPGSTFKVSPTSEIDRTPSRTQAQNTTSYDEDLNPIPNRSTAQSRREQRQERVNQRNQTTNYDENLQPIPTTRERNQARTKANQEAIHFDENLKPRKNFSLTGNNPTNKDANNSSVVQQAKNQASSLLFSINPRGKKLADEMVQGKGLRHSQATMDVVQKNNELHAKLKDLRQQRMQLAQGGKDTADIDNKIADMVSQRKANAQSIKGARRTQTKLGFGDRAMAGLGAAKEYYVGGTFAQSATRIGATGGAIAGLDYLTDDDGY